MKNTKYIVICSRERIPVDEDELIKVYAARKSGTDIMLRQGWFNPAYFVCVVEDTEYMKKFYDDNKYDIRDSKIEAYPEYKDLFGKLRAQVEQARIAGGGPKQIFGNGPNTTGGQIPNKIF